MKRSAPNRYGWRARVPLLPAARIFFFEMSASCGAAQQSMISGIGSYRRGHLVVTAAPLPPDYHVETADQKSAGNVAQLTNHIPLSWYAYWPAYSEQWHKEGKDVKAIRATRIRA